MNLWVALLPLALLLAAGGAIAVTVKLCCNKADKQELPTDVLANLFIDSED
ncbi:MAG: hypothetical protein PHG02_06675 [Oscillospiraceae bacterium]|nr:hypothetical protein [Oscillospiraceae bacterium]